MHSWEVKIVTDLQMQKVVNAVLNL